MKNINCRDEKILSTLTVCVALAGALNAQDPNFLNFCLAAFLKPGIDGKFDGSFRVAGNYRNQWPTINNAFVTKTASIDFGILKTGWPISISLVWEY